MAEEIIHEEYTQIETFQSLEREVKDLKMQVEDLTYMLHKKIGGGSADVKGVIAQPSTIPAGTIPAGTITKTQVSFEQISVTVSAGQLSGTGTCTSGSVIIGYRSAGNVDQLIDNISLSATTITVTLAANATADNQFVVICLKA